MNDTLSIIAIVVLVIGLAYSLYRNSNKDSKNMGALIQKVNDIDRRLGRIEEKIFDGD